MCAALAASLGRPKWRRRVPLQGPSACQRDEAWAFLHVTRISSYFLRSEGHDMKHIFQIVGLLGFPHNPMILKKKKEIAAYE